jgi:hypothetical protein
MNNLQILKGVEKNDSRRLHHFLFLTHIISFLAGGQVFYRGFLRKVGVS